ncbi:SMI1/KNR4 family protein [Pseudomonas putida]|uniref:SMI1/KNR4 family protein n=1 Tax=Pseudomonas putida TaxID=303 RepID=UPI002271C0AA|nr:SMI1/KNR4 family protein [Pseudomonas putida]WAC00443.1 SMI1/KNR4 family protein [Pseudomonas putida]
MSYIDVLDSEINLSGEEPAFAGGATEEVILAFEKALSVKFPDSYKEFLRKYGALSFAGDTYYGITKNGVDAVSIPSVAFATKSARAAGEADDSMIVVKASGYGPIYSIDTSITGAAGKPAVVETELSFKRKKDKKVISQDFQEFFTDMVRQAIKQL